MEMRYLMNIPQEGIDCKGRPYKQCELKKAVDLSNKQFHYLTPLFRVEGSCTCWLCRCKCGNLTIVPANALNAGRVKSCGCYMVEQVRKLAKLDRTGQRFGELTIESRAYIPKKKGTFWNCLCSCGKRKIIREECLVYGYTKSCGHLKTQIEDLSGQDYGFWHVLSMAPRKGPHISWICQCKCGTIKEVRGDELKRGASSSCGCKTSSKGADNIEKILQLNKINYKKEYCFSNLLSPKKAPLRFDFAIFNDGLQYLIEFDGELHYQSRDDFAGEDGLKYRQLCDTIKNQYCIKNKIPLYRIPYFDSNIKNLNDILQEKYLIS